MITIDRAFFSRDRNKLNLILSSDDTTATPFSDISSIKLSKYPNLNEELFEYNKDVKIPMFDTLPMINPITLTNAAISAYSILTTDGPYINVVASAGNLGMVVALNELNSDAIYTKTIYITSPNSTANSSISFYIDAETSSDVIQLIVGKEYKVIYTGVANSYTVTDLGFKPTDEEVTTINTREMLVSIDIVSDIDKLSTSNSEFSTNGITKVIVAYDNYKAISLVIDEGEFYSYKTAMLNISCDTSNVQKLSKKLNTFSFLEQLLLFSVANRYVGDSIFYYNEMIRISSIGYSDISILNPNCNY